MADNLPVPMDEDEITEGIDLEVMSELEVFKKFLDMQEPEELAFYRLKLEDAAAGIRKLKAALDEVCLRRMKEKGQKEFTLGKYKCYRAPEVTKKIKDTRVLVKLLKSEDATEREMAFNALSGGQSAWKMAQVELIEGTLGGTGNVPKEIVEKKKGDKIVFKMVDQTFLPDFRKKDEPDKLSV